MADALERLIERLDHLEARVADLDARLYGTLAEPYPAGPYGLRCFKSEGEARVAWTLLQMNL